MNDKLSWFRRSVLAVTFCSFTGCTTMQPLDVRHLPPPVGTSIQLRPGDWAHITMYNKTVYDLEVLEVDATSVVGKKEDGAVIRLDASQISLAEVKRISGWRTFFATVGTLAVIALGVAWYAASRFEPNCDQLCQ